MAQCDITVIEKDIIAAIKAQTGDDSNSMTEWQVGQIMQQAIVVRQERIRTVEYRADPTNTEEYVNHSGGAAGADTVWGDVASEYIENFKNNHYFIPDDTNNPPNANLSLASTDIAEGKAQVTKAARKIGLATPTRKITNKKLIRNWAQVKYADAIFAVTPITQKGDKPMRFRADRSGNTDTRIATEDTGSGGTTYAIEMAKELKKPIYVFDDTQALSGEDTKQTGKWHKWDYKTNSWQEMAKPPKLTNNFAGIGSTAMSEEGRTAINGLFKAQFKEKLPSAKLVLDKEVAIDDNAVLFSGSSKGNTNPKENQWLSNMAELAVPIKDKHGLEYYSAEAFFQAMKQDKKADREKYTYKGNGFKALTLARKEAKMTAEQQKAWNAKRVDVMREAHKQKFTKNSELAQRLLNTKDLQLVENTIHDSFWGQSKESGKGTNVNGKLLESARAALQEKLTPIVEYNVDPHNILAIAAKDNSTQAKRDAKMEREDAHNRGEGTYSMRVWPGEYFDGLDSTHHYGNPFGTKGYGSHATIPTNDSGPVVSRRYGDWLQGKSDQDVEPERRDWINQQIADGKLNDAQLIYWEDSKTLTHAKVLRDIVAQSQKDRTVPVTQEVATTPVQPVTQHVSTEAMDVGTIANLLGLEGKAPEGYKPTAKELIEAQQVVADVYVNRGKLTKADKAKLEAILPISAYETLNILEENGAARAKRATKSAKKYGSGKLLEESQYGKVTKSQEMNHYLVQLAEEINEYVEEAEGVADKPNDLLYKLLQVQKRLYKIQRFTATTVNKDTGKTNHQMAREAMVDYGYTNYLIAFDNATDGDYSILTKMIAGDVVEHLRKTRPNQFKENTLRYNSKENPGFAITPNKDGSKREQAAEETAGPSPVYPPNTERMGSEATTEQRFKEGEAVEVFSEFVVKGPKGEDWHVTWDFNPQTQGNPDGPAKLITQGKKAVVKVVGTYKDSLMEYDVVEITVDGKTYTHQPSGIPLHITKYVNKEKNIKPFMTGQHAKKGKFTTVAKGAKYAGTSNTFMGKYNPKFDKTWNTMGSDTDQAFEENSRLYPTEEFALDDSILDLADFFANEDIATGHTDPNQLHLLKLIENYAKTFQDMGVSGDTMTIDMFKTAQTKQRETFIRGDADIDAKNVRIDLGGSKAFSTSLEIFAHEVQHVLIEKALSVHPGLKKKIQKLRRQVASKIDKATNGEGYKMFLTNKPTPTSAEVAQAKKLYEYIFHNPAYPESEFLAYASTNRFMQATLEQHMPSEELFKQFDNETVFNARGRQVRGKMYNVKKFVNRLIEGINKWYSKLTYESKNGKEVIDDVLHQLLNISAAASKGASLPVEPDGKFMKLYKKADNKAVTALKRITEGKEAKVKDDNILNTAPTDSVSQWLDRVTDKKSLIGLKQKLVRSHVFNSVLRDTADPKVGWFYDLFRKSKADIDSSVQELKHETVTSLMTGINGHEGLEVFTTKDPKTGKVDESILQSMKKALLNTDYAAITDTVVGMTPFLEDIGKVHKEIRAVRKGLQKEVVVAAERLGVKLATGVNTDVNGYINALEIGRAFNLTTDEVVAVDKLASLYAVANIGNEDRNNTLKALKQNASIIQNSMNIYYADRKRLHDTVYTDGRQILEEKGFHILHKEGNKTQHIVPASQLKAMLDSGMKLIRETTNPSMVEKQLEEILGEPHYIVAGTDIDTAYTQGLINTVQIKAEGMSLKRVLRELSDMDISEINGIVDKLAQGVPVKSVVNTVDTAMTPERNLAGRIIDYKIKLSYADQEAHLGLNDNIARVIANTAANLSHKQKAITSNLNAVAHMLEYAEANYKGNEDQFVVLRGTNEDERRTGKEYEYAQQWNIIPDYARKEIERLSGSASIRVPNAMFVDFIGYKDASLTELGWIKKNRRLAGGVRKFEKLWVEVVGLAKKSIVTKMWSTIKNNSVSNMIVTMLRLRMVNPGTYMKKFSNAWEDLNRYQALNREIIQMELAQKSGEAIEPGRIASLKKELEDNPAHELMQDGQYSSILEDIDLDMTAEDGFVAEAADKILGKLPKGTKDITDVVFMTNKSWIYSKVVKLTQLQDIANRMILREGGVDLRETDKIFVNYSYLDNRWIKWFNDMGLLMFTKYMTRSLSAMGTFVKKNPLALGLFLGARSITNTESWLETPIDGYFDPASTLMNKIHGDDPLDILAHGLFPFMFYTD